MEVQLNKPLATGCLISWKTIERPFDSNFKYEQLPNFFTLCGMLTHGFKDFWLTKSNNFQVLPTTFVPNFGELLRVGFDSLSSIAH